MVHLCVRPTKAHNHTYVTKITQILKNFKLNPIILFKILLLENLLYLCHTSGTEIYPPRSIVYTNSNYTKWKKTKDFS